MFLLYFSWTMSEYHLLLFLRCYGKDQDFCSSSTDGTYYILPYIQHSLGFFVL